MHALGYRLRWIATAALLITSATVGVTASGSPVASGAVRVTADAPGQGGPGTTGTTGTTEKADTTSSSDKTPPVKVTLLRLARGVYPERLISVIGQLLPGLKMQARQNAILIVGRDDQLQAAKAIAANEGALPAAEPANAASIPFEKASDAARDTLKQLLEKAAPDLVFAFDGSNVVVYGTDSDIQTAKDLISQIHDKKQPKEVQFVELYPLQYITPDVARKLLTEAQIGISVSPIQTAPQLPQPPSRLRKQDTYSDGDAFTLGVPPQTAPPTEPTPPARETNPSKAVTADVETAGTYSTLSVRLRPENSVESLQHLRRTLLRIQHDARWEASTKEKLEKRYPELALYLDHWGLLGRDPDEIRSALFLLNEIGDPDALPALRELVVYWLNNGLEFQGLPKEDLGPDETRFPTVHFVGDPKWVLKAYDYAQESGAVGFGGASSVTLTGTAEQIVQSMQLLSRIDVPQPQVVVEARLLEYSPEDIERLGVHWTDPDGVLTSTKITESNRPSLIRFGRIGRSGLQFQATLSALQSKGKVRVLSSPSISVVQGTEGFIHVGDTINFLAQQNVDAQGHVTLATSHEEIGINLTVNPTIHLADGAVTMLIHPQVSSLIQFVPVPGGGVLPRLNKREAKTTVRLNDGELLAIGGLISNEDVEVTERIPYLAQLPFFGKLFQNRRKDKRRMEVTMLLSPHIVYTNEPLHQPVFNEDAPTTLPALPPRLPGKQPRLESLTLETYQVAGVATITGTVTLSKDAPQGGAKIELVVGRPEFAQLDVESVVIPHGKREGTFTITTHETDRQRITNVFATYNGLQRKTALYIKPPEP